MNTENLCMGCMREKSEGVSKCLKCGYVEGAPHLPSYLAPRTVLQERYLVGKLLSYNGSGATYMGYDCIMNCKVKIREYMPENLATREKGNPVVKEQAGSEIQYKSLKLDFVDLARHLVKLNSLQEVEHVNDIFEANNTAYVVYEYIEGMTLSEFLKKNGGYLSWEDTKQLFMPLLSCISAIHTSEIIHRGISPDTILVDRSGNLKLTSFDIAPARTARSELVAQLFAGYAAPEQYASSAWQGTNTDVYALAATIYRTLTGTMPVEAISRVSNDNLVAANSLNPEIPKNVSNALLSAMALSPEKRTETVSAFLSELSEVIDAPDAGVKTEMGATGEDDKSAKKKGLSSMAYALIAAGITGVVVFVIFFILFGLIWGFGSGKKPSKDPNEGLSSIIASSDNESEGASSEVHYIQTVPYFVEKNYEAIINDEDYTELYEIKLLEYVYDEQVSAGEIISQSVEAGTPVEKTGTVIEVVVSRGSRYRKMPDLIGKNIDYVKDTLYGMEIRYEVETEKENYGDPDVVCNTSIEKDKVIDISQPHSVIVYVYEQEPEEETSSEDLSWIEELEQE